MTVKLYTGDCREVLRTLADGSVQCVITSPPYYGLRDYGVNGQIGLENTPTEYVQHLVEVFREVKRVLRVDGTCWLNLGDSYAGSWGNYAPGGIKSQQRPQTENGKRWDRRAYSSTDVLPPTANVPGLKPKDLIGIPWRVALALQADGWWLRSSPPWIKRNCMPESVTDRPTTAHEFVFLLSKSRKYYYDAEAVKVPSTGQIGQAADFARSTKDHLIPNQAAQQHRLNRKSTKDNGSRNRRTSDTFNESLDLRIEQQRGYLAHLEHVRDNGGMLQAEDGSPLAFMVNTRGFKKAHFATFPPKLIEPMIAAGTKEGDTVLDPFGGAGTVGLVADRMGRDAILIDLNGEYVEMAHKRIAGDAPMFTDVRRVTPT